MIKLLERQNRLTANQWKIIATASIGNALDFFDFFLIGLAFAFILKGWHLTYWQGALILVASGVGAVPGAFFWGWMADKIGRRKVLILTAINIAVATGITALTPDSGGWIFLVAFRFVVGMGTAGFYATGIVLVQEFVPSSKRGWTSALPSVLAAPGNLLGGVAAGYLAPIIGWRWLLAIGLVPVLLIPMIRYWVPESPHWLIGIGRHDEARKSLAWALQIDSKEVGLPRPLPGVKRMAWWELFKYPRSVVTACLTGLTQTGGAGLGLWGAVLLVMVLQVSPSEAAFLWIFVSVTAALGYIFGICVIDVLGRRLWGGLACLIAAVTMALAGYLNDVYIGTVSMFLVMVLVQTFFSSGNNAIVGPYLAEVWPMRLRASGMGLGYGVGNTGKIIGPLGLALIVGSSEYVNPKANVDALGPAFLYCAFWYVLGAVAFWFIGFETKGRSIEEIDDALAKSHAAGD